MAFHDAQTPEDLDDGEPEALDRCADCDAPANTRLDGDPLCEECAERRREQCDD